MRRAFVGWVIAAGLLGTACGDGGERGAGAGGDGSADNLVLAEACAAVGDCGGDPVGHWEIVGGCMQAPASEFDCERVFERFHGNASGTLVLGAVSGSDGDGVFELDVHSEFHPCGGSGSGGRNLSGSYMLEGDNVLRVTDDTAFTFCVEGDTLWLTAHADYYPHLTTYELRRVDDMSSAGST